MTTPLGKVEQKADEKAKREYTYQFLLSNSKQGAPHPDCQLFVANGTDALIFRVYEKGHLVVSFCVKSDDIIARAIKGNLDNESIELYEKYRHLVE